MKKLLIIGLMLAGQMCFASYERSVSEILESVDAAYKNISLGQSRRSVPAYVTTKHKSAFDLNKSLEDSKQYDHLKHIKHFESEELKFIFSIANKSNTGKTFTRLADLPIKLNILDPKTNESGIIQILPDSDSTTEPKCDDNGQFLESYLPQSFKNLTGCNIFGGYNKSNQKKAMKDAKFAQNQFNSQEQNFPAKLAEYQRSLPTFNMSTLKQDLSV